MLGMTKCVLDGHVGIGLRGFCHADHELVVRLIEIVMHSAEVEPFKPEAPVLMLRWFAFSSPRPHPLAATKVAQMSRF